MNDSRDSLSNESPDSALRAHAAELLRSNELLQDEVRQLRERNKELAERLVTLGAGSQAERESRRAALNLLEDAVAARKAEERENSERRRIEEMLREAHRRKDEFLATLAHELRNPLAPIRNSLEIMHLAGDDIGAVARVREIMERQVSHLVRLVDDLLEISRISLGKVELRKEPVDLASVIRHAVEISKPLIEASQHQLAICLPPDPLSLLADPVRLSQVVSNLLNNAAKYTEKGGQIWLTVRREESSIVVSVRDTGIGISHEMLPKVFELFVQADCTPDRIHGGLGIGLTLVRNLVEAHGGSVEAKSEGLGEGSEFIIRLPFAAERSVAHRAGPRANQKAEFSGLHILVVDDNRDAANSLLTILRLWGAEVRAAYDGQTALKTIRDFRPSVVLLDIGMPGMDGNEVARRIRQQTELQDMKLVALTGWGQEQDRRLCKESGFDHHLVKPVEINALTDLLNSLPPTLGPHRGSNI